MLVDLTTLFLTDFLGVSSWSLRSVAVIKTLSNLEAALIHLTFEPSTIIATG